jgi:hypothetical protein
MYFEVWGYDKYSGDAYFCARYLYGKCAEREKAKCEMSVKQTQGKALRDSFWIEAHSVEDVEEREKLKMAWLKECRKFWTIDEDNLVNLSTRLAEMIMAVSKEERQPGSRLLMHKFSVENPLKECYSLLKAVYYRRWKRLDFGIEIPGHLFCQFSSDFDWNAVPTLSGLIEMQKDYYHCAIKEAMHTEL